MKSLKLGILAGLLSLGMAAAQAQTTVNLYPAGTCNAYCTCSAIETDIAEVEINYLTPTSVSVGNDVYSGSSVYQSQLYDSTGKMIIASLTFSKWTTKTVSGRGAGAKIQHCAFVGGTITF